MSEIQKLTEMLKRTPYLEMAILFGSLASGTARGDSDVDIAVSIGRAMSAAERAALVGDIATLTGRSVDLVDLKRVGEPLLGQILVNGKRLVGTDETYAALLSRHLIDQADFMPYRNRILDERRRAWIGS